VTARIAVALGSVALLFLSGCAPAPALRWAPGLALVNPGSSLAPLPSARAVRVESRCALRGRGRNLHFETILVADSSRGRLEAVGPFGMTLASVIWRDSTWEVWLPSQGTLIRGTGDSLSLPVVGMRSIRPRELVGTYLGRPIPAQSGVPLRTLNRDESQVVVVPVQPSPGWSLTLDRKSGLPKILQIMRHNQEAERIHFGAWRDHSGTPVPDSIVRTVGSDEELSLFLTSWEPQDTLPSNLFSFTFQKPVDTIFLGLDGAGHTRYRIHPAVPGTEAASESAMDSLMDPDSLGDEDSTEVDDSLDVTPQHSSPAPAPPRQTSDPIAPPQAPASRAKPPDLELKPR